MRTKKILLISRKKPSQIGSTPLRTCSRISDKIKPRRQWISERTRSMLLKKSSHLCPWQVRTAQRPRATYLCCALGPFWMSVAVWLRRVSVPRLWCFYTTNKINVLTPESDQEVLTDDLSPNPCTFLIPHCPPHKCTTAVHPKRVFLCETSYIEVISFKWASWERELRVRVFVG